MGFNSGFKGLIRYGCMQGNFRRPVLNYSASYSRYHEIRPRYLRPAILNTAFLYFPAVSPGKYQHRTSKEATTPSLHILPIYYALIALLYCTNTSSLDETRMCFCNSQLTQTFYYLNPDLHLIFTPTST